MGTTDEQDQQPPSARTETVGSTTALIVVACAGVGLLGGIFAIVWSSHALFERGVDAAICLSADPARSTTVARRVFLLASGHQIATFKAISYGLAVLLALVGVVLVLNGARAIYSLRGATNEVQGARGALITTSPGLVVITLAVALAGGTLASKSTLQDHRDWDISSPSSSGVDGSRSRIDEIRTRQIERTGEEQPGETSAAPDRAAIRARQRERTNQEGNKP